MKSPAISALLATVGTLVVSYLFLAQTFVTKADLDVAIKYHTPYMLDKEWLTKQVAAGAQSATKVENAIEKLADTVGTLRLEVTRLGTKIEMMNGKKD